MRCPNCEFDIHIEDWHDDSPFECENCDETLQLIIDEGTYLGATDSRLIVFEDE